MNDHMNPLTRRRFLTWSGVAAAGALATVGATQVDWDDLMSAAEVFSPANNGGSTGSMASACSGLPSVASSQRPSHPVCTGVCGEAVCQMPIDRKWLWSGFG